MNIISSEIVSNKNLDMIGRRNRIDSLVNRNPSQQGIVSEVTLTATVEAIIGAVYLDSGRSTAEVRRVMERLGLWPEPQQQ
jgi:ribonuclease-3